MEKIQQKFDEDERIEKEFRDKMSMRERIKRLKGEIAKTEKDSARQSVEIDKLEAKKADVLADLHVLETQMRTLTDDIRKKLEGVLKDEEKLKKLREEVQNEMRMEIKTCNEYLQTRMDPENDFSVPDPKFQEQIEEHKKRVWALEGEIEAMELILKFQANKLQEKDQIGQVIWANLPQVSYSSDDE